MSKALLKLVLIFALISLLNAAAPTIGPLSTLSPSDAPGVCQGVPPGGTANTAAYASAVTKFFASGEMGSIAIALMALIISFDIVAIAYMLSRFFPHLGIRNWLQAEYIEIAKSAILIAIIYSTVAIAGNIANAFLGTPPASSSTVAMSSLVQNAETYLCGVNTNLMMVWDWIGLLGAGTGFWAGFRVGFYIPLPIPPFLSLYSGATLLPYANWALQTGNPSIGFYGSIIG
ncbi:MAG: hypothetical protein KGH62_04165, partial [Candidatus Micrarchaeota archaeon]|nr:hypothetical protein [Candidatus Micrarchaeota archaeon]